MLYNLVPYSTMMNKVNKNLIQAKTIMKQTLEIETRGLSYYYSKEVKTLDNINLAVEKGTVFGFLGPNGSGKTTTLSLLLGLLKTQQGSIHVFGKDIQTHRVEVLKKIGSLIEKPSLYGHLSARENLEIYRPLYNASKEKITEVLKIVGLSDTGKKQSRKFSLGMKQRLSIALALLPSPELLVLDEPTNGLDPTGIIELRQLISRLNREYGMTILVSSHILAEVEKMVTHLGIIANGKMLFQGSLKKLYALQQAQSVVQLKTSDNQAAINCLRKFEVQQQEDKLTVTYAVPAQLSDINKLLVTNNIDVYLLQPVEQNLEQLFIDLTSK